MAAVPAVAPAGVEGAAVVMVPPVDPIEVAAVDAQADAVTKAEAVATASESPTTTVAAARVNEL
jgi:hypothetical protein